MVGVAQLVERRVVVADVAGSSPVTHPTQVYPTGPGRADREQQGPPTRSPDGEGRRSVIENGTLSAAAAVQLVAELAAELAGAPSLEELLEHALSLAVDIVPGCEQAGISLLQHGVV